MCGIGGFVPLVPDAFTCDDAFDITVELLKENKVRGRDASGFANWPDLGKVINVVKSPADAGEFTSHLTKEMISVAPTIIHTRAGTSGTELNNENNHPIYGKRFVMVHNGVVSAMPDLEGYTYKGDCDTERLLSALEMFGVRNGIESIIGSASIAVFDSVEKDLILFKHNNPLYALLIPDKIFAFSSVKDPLDFITNRLCTEKRMGFFPNAHFKELREGDLFTINLETMENTIDNLTILTKWVRSRENNTKIYNFC